MTWESKEKHQNFIALFSTKLIHPNEQNSSKFKRVKLNKLGYSTWLFKFAQAEEQTWGQCYKTFYHDNLLPFHGNTIILCYKAILPW
jgi:hypothetical protein